MRKSKKYKGFLVQQHARIEEVLEIFSNKLKQKPAQIIEIGTLRGGFTLILADSTLSDDADIYTFDIKNSSLNSKEYEHRNFCFLKQNITYFEKDCFDHEAKKIIISLIQKPGLTLLFCDGGNKKKEINTFSKYLKKGDFIFGHDYAYDKIFFEKYIKRKIWNVLELTYKQIEKEIEKANIQNCLQKLFGQVVWFCGIKK